MTDHETYNGPYDHPHNDPSYICYRELPVKRRRLRALSVRALGELRGWRLLHEDRLLYECLSCGEECFHDNDYSGRIYKVHYFRDTMDAECISHSRLPSRVSFALFRKLHLSQLLQAFEELTDQLRTGYCPSCGQPIIHSCTRHYETDGIGVIGYQ